MAAKILVVDDESDLELLIRQKFRHAIKSGELLFDFALNGVEALKKLEGDREYSMVITDINMPEMDGLTLLGKIGEMDRPLKAVVISAYGDMGNIRTAMNRGAFDFITKPIDLKDLEVTIAKTLRETDAIRQGLAAKENLGKALFEKDKAEEAKRFEQQFLANMSHEIRTPMNAVIGMTNLVLKTELNERQRKYVDAIRVSSENLLGIINDILDISKIEAGKIDLESIPFSVKDVLGNVYTVLHLKAEEKSLSLVMETGETVPQALLG
ncbi:MAG TPA: histidine kinase dimerization/phospho-acceptor domain-containing protein, partial [Bacteroidia bacterium]|nr:histidine kinase dimerization/phospho-acceptor domain-containing protein [Bacteroidia bacterium]